MDDGIILKIKKTNLVLFLRVIKQDVLEICEATGI